MPCILDLPIFCANAMQSPRVLRSGGTTYNRAETEEYRIDTRTLTSRSGLGIGSFGESMPRAKASLRADMLITAVFPRPVVILAGGVRKVLLPLGYSSETGSRDRRQRSSPSNKP